MRAIRITPGSQADSLRSALSRRRVVHFERWPGTIRFDLSDVEQYIFAGSPFPAGRVQVVHGQREAVDAAGLGASAIHRKFAAGDSIVLKGAHRSIPKLASLASELGTLVDAEVRINVYVTPPSSAGFPLHYDDHDVVMLQTFGEKRWQIYAKAAKPVDLSGLSPLQRAIVAATPSPCAGPSFGKGLVAEFILSTGGMLFLPSGVPHVGATHDAASVHLTASVRKPSSAEVESLNLFAIRLQQHKSPGVHHQRSHKRLIESLVGLQRERERAPTPSRYLDSLARLSEVADETWCEWRPNLKPKFTQVGERAMVIFHETAVPVERDLLPMWDYVLSTQTFKVGSLPLETASERQVAATELVRAGLLQFVGDSELADS